MKIFKSVIKIVVVKGWRCEQFPTQHVQTS